MWTFSPVTFRLCLHEHFGLEQEGILGKWLLHPGGNIEPGCQQQTTAISSPSRGQQPPNLTRLESLGEKGRYPRQHGFCKEEGMNSDLQVGEQIWYQCRLGLFHRLDLYVMSLVLMPSHYLAIYSFCDMKSSFSILKIKSANHSDNDHRNKLKFVSNLRVCSVLISGVVKALSFTLQCESSFPCHTVIIHFL